MVRALGLLLVLALPAAAGDLSRALERARRAAHSGTAEELARELEAVLEEDGKAAARGLLELAAGLPPGREGAHWQVLRALAALEGDSALDALESFLRKGEPAPLCRDLLFALQGRNSDGQVKLFAALLKDEKARLELRLMACDRLGESATPAAVDALLRLLDKEQGRSSELEAAARRTLVGLAGGEDMGDIANWQGWWKGHRGQPLPVRREGASTASVDSTGQTVRGQLDPARAGGLSSLTRRGRVVVIRGTIRNYDQIELVLRRMGVEHQVLTKAVFLADVEAGLQNTAALLLNCNLFTPVCHCPTCKPGKDLGRGPACAGCDEHDRREDAFPDEVVARIARHVREGGSLFTEDFGLYELVARAWPELVGVAGVLSEGDVDWLPAPGQTAHPLLRGVLGAAPGEATRTRPLTGKWKVDAISPAIAVKDPARVRVLLFSPELRARDPNGAALAVAFSPGEELEAAAPPPGKRKQTGKDAATRPARAGVVLHVLSHFGKQTSQSDEFALQNMLVNFLLEAADRWRERRR